MAGVLGRAAPAVGMAVLALLASAAVTAQAAGGVSASEPAAAASMGRPAAQAGFVWHKAIEVPGTAALNTDGSAQVTSVSCASSGSCSAGGNYFYSSDSAPYSISEAFVVSEVNGRWGTAVEVPGVAALNTAGRAGVSAVSCPSAGNCTAAGYFTGIAGQQLFVVSEVNGTWNNAAELPGIEALNTGAKANIDAISCVLAGNCSVGGYYTDNSINQFQYPFVASEVNGVWSDAIGIPGSLGASCYGCAATDSVSCASAGNCTAGGYYSGGPTLAFVVSEVNGTWGKAITVPGVGSADSAAINSVSCGSAGNCSAGGWYSAASGHLQAFVIGEVNGSWGAGVEVPGTAALNFRDAMVNTVSCTSAGTCGAAGFYSDAEGYHFEQPFVVSETNGKWGTAAEVPGIAPLNVEDAQAISLSCASAGNCSVGGYYTGFTGPSGSYPQQVFVADETNGVWTPAQEVPGTYALNAGDRSALNSLSCAPAGACGAGGYYEDKDNNNQAFVVSQAPPQSQTIGFAGPRTGIYGGSAKLTATGGGSGNPVVFSVDPSGTPRACAVFGTHGSTVRYSKTGRCVIDANQAGGNGYNPAAQVQQAITIKPAPLTITASSAKMTFGGKPPAITPIYAGFVAGDRPSSLTTRPACSTTAETFSLPGAYPSACSGASDPSYRITYRPGTVDVTALNYLAMGDSFSSGEGLPPFVYLGQNTDTSRDQCHRSSKSYPATVAQALPKIINQKTLEDVACSGATTANVAWGFPLNHENAQISHVARTVNLVTISVGGDDADFVGVMQSCVKTPTSGSSDCKNAKAADPGHAGKKISLDRRESILISDLGTDRYCRKSGKLVDCQPSLHTVYEKIASKAPSALVLVILYPHLFTNAPAPGGCDPAVIGGVANVSKLNIEWINAEADKLDAKVIAEAKIARGHGVHIRWIDPRPHWGNTDRGASPGGHGVCTKRPWLNGLVAPVVYSFHPNRLGQAEFASEILLSKLTP